METMRTETKLNIDAEELSIPSSSPSACNRRLSRAARSFIEAHLRLYVFQDDPKVNDDDDIWTLMEYWLHDAQPRECPLFPSRDMWRYDEESMAVPYMPPSNLNGAYPISILKERRRKGSSKRPRRWWQCRICSKVFHSRYYMDLHSWSHHHHHHHQSYRHQQQDHLERIMTSSINNHELHNNFDPMMVCPAEEWCQLVGMANCHAQALRDEPYYGRGSNGWGEDAILMKHKFIKIAQSIPCNVEQIQTDCIHILLDTCHLHDNTHSKSLKFFCETLTCPNVANFFQQEQDQKQYGLIHSSILRPWQFVWTSPNTDHSISGALLGVAFCVLICGWVYYMVTVNISFLKKKKV